MKENWERKYFPAILNLKLGAARANDGFFGGLLRRSPPVQPVFVLMCRLARRPHRANAINLFVMKGYFLAVADQAKNLADLAGLLQNIMDREEEGGFEMEGFLCQGEGRAWEINHFGSGLKLSVDDKWRDLPERPPLGHKDFKTRRTLKLRAPERVELNIKSYSLLSIEQSSGQ